MEELNDIDQSSARFMINHYKVDKCSHTHKRGKYCPYIHDGETSQRRDLNKHYYSCKTCPDFNKGACLNGDRCPNAHGQLEVCLHPDIFRTRKCDYGANCKMKLKSVCFFAQSEEEDRSSLVEQKQQHLILNINEARLGSSSVHGSSSGVQNINEEANMSAAAFNNENDEPVVKGVDQINSNKLKMPFEDSERMPQPRFPPIGPQTAANINNQPQQQQPHDQSVLALFELDFSRAVADLYRSPMHPPCRMPPRSL
ncbi:hypothetical protein C2S53_018610 [Perilla frutescens var. hirtella]|uniref:C3H1-type domain-containing protein n=1 Tax=Perilla frutescens var. hirtella TaxID=608512 RepID=A0AAD4J7N2_PERFH|nr:hypothetical protein C2S53_018610 [Perilla frutescens var. hirtella]